MPEVVCNKAEEYGCNYNVCYHAELHERTIECDLECPIHDTNAECVEVK